MDPKGMTAVLEASSLLVDVSELLHHPGAAKHISVEHEVGGLALDLARIEDAPIRCDLDLHAVVEGVLATGTVTGRARVECRRCLSETVADVTVEVDEVFSSGPGDGDVYRVRGERIDLEPLVRDAIVLALPLNPLCRADCKGLCSRCGQNLNDADCGHRPSTGDARWEPLRRLNEQIGE